MPAKQRSVVRSNQNQKISIQTRKGDIIGGLISSWTLLSRLPLSLVTLSRSQLPISESGSKRRRDTRHPGDSAGVRGSDSRPPYLG